MEWCELCSGKEPWLMGRTYAFSPANLATSSGHPRNTQFIPDRNKLRTTME